jgi:Antitoxin ParD
MMTLVKTSQLQIRVTPQQKEALRRLAHLAGQSVSSYVLAQALPPAHEDFSAAVRDLTRAGDDSRAAARTLWTLLCDTPADDLDTLAAHQPQAGASPVATNLVAALFEQAAYDKGVELSNSWTRDIPPLERPHFTWALQSLRPHQIRVTPTAFKRRNLFFDPASGPVGRPPTPKPPLRATPSPTAEALRRLLPLSAELTDLELDVEFYSIGGALMCQAFPSRPPTASVAALFRSPQPVWEAAARVAAREGWPSEWLSSTVKSYLAPGGARFLEMPHLKMFVPPLEYALAVKLAALRLGADAQAVDDVRYVLRAANVTSTEEALSTVTPYFAERQLAPETRTILKELLGN